MLAENRTLPPFTQHFWSDHNGIDLPFSGRTDSDPLTATQRGFRQLVLFPQADHIGIPLPVLWTVFDSIHFLRIKLPRINPFAKVSIVYLPYRPRHLPLRALQGHNEVSKNRRTAYFDRDNVASSNVPGAGHPIHILRIVR